MEVNLTRELHRDGGSSLRTIAAKLVEYNMKVGGIHLESCEGGGIGNREEKIHDRDIKMP